MGRDDWHLPAWATVLSIVFGVMAGFLVAVLDSVFLFSGTGTRFAIVLVIGSLLGMLLIYAWMVELKTAGNRREQARQRLEGMSDRQVWIFVIALLVLGAFWVLEKLSWFSLL